MSRLSAECESVRAKLCAKERMCDDVSDELSNVREQLITEKYKVRELDKQIANTVAQLSQAAVSGVSGAVPRERGW